MGKLLLRTDVNYNEHSDFSIKQNHIQYALNIIESYELSEDLLEFVLSLTRIDIRKEIVEYLYTNRIPEKKENSNHNYDNKHHNIIKSLSTIRDFDNYDNNYYSIIKSLSDIRDIARDISSDIFNNRLEVKKEEIVGFLKKILTTELELILLNTNDDFSKKLRELADIFDLDNNDIDILVFIYCTYEINSNILGCCCTELEFMEFLRFTSIATGISLHEVKKRISVRGKLFSCGIIESINPKGGDFVELDNIVTEYLAGISDISLMEKYIKRDKKSALSLNNYAISKDNIELIKALLASGASAVNILLYGKAGTGKTEFARSISASTGKDIYFLQYGEEKNNNNSRGSNNDTDKRLLALNVAINSVSSKKGILIVDEADFLLNTKSMFFSVSNTTEKGWLNNLLENSDAKIIWISNEVGLMEESTLRRFSYSLYFKEFTNNERENVWKNLLKEHPLKKYITSHSVKKLSSDYQVNAGAIASALDALVSIYNDTEPQKQDVLMLLNEMLSSHESLISGKYNNKNKQNLHDLTSKYDISALNIDVDSNIVTRAVKQFSETIQKESNPKNFNMNLLFWGVPGSGKTEYAKFLAKKSGMKLIVKRYSDLESKYVGETEQNIASAFKEAERKKAILFVDEADSFFTSRDSAYRSWEISRTNEFLTQMENHNGILICCTNLLPNMDKAAMRRFNWKIEFKPLLPKAKLALYKKYFKLNGKNISHNHKNRIMQISDITPGDLKAVWQRCRFIPDDELTHIRIIEELEKEAVYKRDGNARKAGF